MNPWGFTVIVLGIVLVVVAWTNSMGNVYYMVTGKKPTVKQGSGTVPAPFDLNPFDWGAALGNALLHKPSASTSPTGTVRL